MLCIHFTAASLDDYYLSACALDNLLHGCVVAAPTALERTLWFQTQCMTAMC